jgi:hypothetical protein
MPFQGTEFMSDLSISQLELFVQRKWQMVCPNSLFHLRVKRSDDGGEHVECRGDGFHVIGTERGQETSHCGPFSFDETCKYILFNLSKGKSLSEELQSRTKPAFFKRRYSWNGSRFYLKDSGYSRWNWLYPTIEKMQIMSESLGEYAMCEVSVILRNAPLSITEVRNANYPIQNDDVALYD